MLLTFYAMAKVVINELLCFIPHNFDKLTISQLKPVVCNFYKEDHSMFGKRYSFKRHSSSGQFKHVVYGLPTKPVPVEL